MKEYNPIYCEHKLDNGFTAWQFQSEEQSNLGGPNKVVIYVCQLCGEISIGGFRPSKDGQRTNNFDEKFNICHPDAIDAIIKQANFYNEEVKWGRIDSPSPLDETTLQAEAMGQLLMDKDGEIEGLKNEVAELREACASYRNAYFRKINGD